jgi:sodium/hydrogen exchanger 8
LRDAATETTMMDTLNAMGFRLTKEDSSTIVASSNATEAYEKAEEEHAFDAVTSLFINLTIIGCLILAYYVKKFRIYYLPESSGALIVGMILGGIARLSTDKLQLFEFVSDEKRKRKDSLIQSLKYSLESIYLSIYHSFIHSHSSKLIIAHSQSPEFFFFVLLPPIIFHSGYALDSSHFFDNIGAITLFAFFGTIISTFVIGGCTFYAAKAGLISGIDKENPMEALLFGALISAVDPVATLSIMGNADLRCDQLLYSLVFGESVLNDAIAISLFKVFAKYYEASALNFKESDIPSALMSFISVSFFSILVGIGLGLLPSFLYKNTTLSDYPSLETALLFSFCYLCYAAGEVLGLSGIMALFFQGVTLAHYNSYNLSPTAHVASEQLFATLATLTETAGTIFLLTALHRIIILFLTLYLSRPSVFLYMGMSVFTGLFKDYDIIFSALALTFCFFGRFMNIFPLSFVSNLCRHKGSNHISIKLQTVLWFAGLRGAIAFALAMNMPGYELSLYFRETYCMR